MTSIQLCPTCGNDNPAGSTICQQCGANLAQAAQIAALTERVAALERLLAAQMAPQQEETAVSPSPPSSPPHIPPSNPLLPPEIWQSDFWLNKVGIGLLLLALAFLFNYAVDQGWLTPAVRVGMGLLLGTILLVFGFRLRQRRPAFGQVLAGGGIAAYYLSGFAAFQLYNLVAHPVAFGFMCLVTLLALLLALRQEAVTLALIGGLGGLATPFLLNTGSGNVIALIIYSTVLTAGLAAIYLLRGWLLLQWLANLGSWLIILAAMLGEDISQLERLTPEGTAVQTGIIITLLLFWLLPVARQLFGQRLPAPYLGLGDSWLGSAGQRLSATHPQLAIWGNWLLGWLLSLILWGGERETWGLVALATAVFLTLTAYALFRFFAHADFSYGHGITAVFFLTIALILLLEDDWLLLSLAVVAVGLHGATRWLGRPTLRFLAHLLSLIVAFWLLARLTDGGGARGETAVFNLTALVDLAIIALTAAITFLVPATATYTRTIYRLSAHVALLLWFVRELSPLDGGQGLVTVAWGIYAIALLLLALRYRQRQVRLIALGTLFLLVGKLFLVDLAALETIWRILLFAGFGGLFLLISYHYRAWLGLGEEGDR